MSTDTIELTGVRSDPYMIKYKKYQSEIATSFGNIYKLWTRDYDDRLQIAKTFSIVFKYIKGSVQQPQRRVLATAGILQYTHWHYRAVVKG